MVANLTCVVRTGLLTGVAGVIADLPVVYVAAERCKAGVVSNLAGATGARPGGAVVHPRRAARTISHGATGIGARILAVARVVANRRAGVQTRLKAVAGVVPDGAGQTFAGAIAAARPFANLRVWRDGRRWRGRRRRTWSHRRRGCGRRRECRDGAGCLRRRRHRRAHNVRAILRNAGDAFAVIAVP